MQKGPSPTKHLSLEAKDARCQRWAGAEVCLSMTLIQIQYCLLLQQECTTIFAKEAQWEQFVTIFTNTALQLPLILSATQTSDTATLTHAQTYGEEIFVT